MFLLLVRTSALMLIIGLAAGLVATATAQRGITCPQEIPAGLIRDLWNRTNQLINVLPEEKKFSGGERLLPQFCVLECRNREIGWLEIRELIDMYQRRVFSKKVVQELLPLHYNVLLHRLKNTLHLCVSSSEPSQWFEIIQKLGQKIKRSKKGERALKAIREFIYVLRWIDELARHHNL